MSQGISGLWYCYRTLYRKKDQGFKDRPFGRFDTFIWVLFEVLLAASMFLTAVYWGLLFTGPGTDIYNTSAHALNSFFMLTELSCNRFDVILMHYSFFFSYTIVFVIFAWIFHAAGGWWVYAFLSWSNATSAVIYYIVLFVATCIFFLIGKGFYLLRMKVVEKCSGRKLEDIELDQKADEKSKEKPKEETVEIVTTKEQSEEESNDESKESSSKEPAEPGRVSTTDEDTTSKSDEE